MWCMKGIYCISIQFLHKQNKLKWILSNIHLYMIWFYKRKVTCCGGLAEMPEILSAEIARFATFSRNTCGSQNAFDADNEQKLCLWIQIISLVLTINWLWLGQIVVCNLVFIALQPETIDLSIDFRKLKVLQDNCFCFFPLVDGTTKRTMSISSITWQLCVFH